MAITIPVGIVLVVIGILLIIFRRRIKRCCQRKYNLNNSNMNNDENNKNDNNKENTLEDDLYPSSSNNRTINKIETRNQKDEYPEKEEINNNNCATDEFIGGKPYYSENNYNGYPSSE